MRTDVKIIIATVAFLAGFYATEVLAYNDNCESCLDRYKTCLMATTEGKAIKTECKDQLTECDNLNECSAKDLTYTEDIKPILANSCTECHPGILKYEIVFSQRSKILKKLSNNEMPPKYATGLTNNEKKLVIQWIKAGAKK